MQLSIIRVYDADSSDSNSDRESNNNKGIPKQGSGILAFLEDENSKVIGCCERKQLYAEMQGFWNNNIDSACPPGNWSSVGSLFTTASKIHLKTSSQFYVFVLGDGRLISCGRRITTAGSSPHWLGRLRRQHLMPVALTMAASTSTRSPWNPWILMLRLMNHLTRLD